MKNFLFGSKIRLSLIIFLILIISISFFLFTKFVLPGLRTGDLARHYPKFIKCSWVTENSLIDLTSKVDELNKLGTNTICIMTSIPQFESQKPIVGSLPVIKSAIASLKKAGFAIFLVPDVPGSAQIETEHSGMTNDKYLSIAEEEALKWAAIAEKYKVEFFAPHNELTSRLDSPGSWFDSLEDAAEANDNWHAQILPKVRNTFKGKVVAKFGYFLTNQNASGYDYIGITLDLNFMEDPTDKKSFREKIAKEYLGMADLAKKQGVDWLVSEVYISYEDVPPGSYETEAERSKIQESLKELQDDYFQITIKELLALPGEKRPYGYIPVGYGPKAFGAIDESAKQVVRKYFNTANLR